MKQWILLYVLTGWLVGVVMAVVLARKFVAVQAWAWLAILFAAPWLGLLLYLLLGDDPLSRRSRLRYKPFRDGPSAREMLPLLERHRSRPSLNPEASLLEQLAISCGALPAVGGNAARLLAGHEDVLEALVADIDQAEQQVHLVFYIFHDDATGRRIEEALCRAAGRGVECRVLVDAIGSRGALRSVGGRLRRAGVRMCASLPVSLVRRQMSRLDLRNHRKLVVVDGRIGYLGSWNATNPDYGRGGGIAYHDAMVRVQGPIVMQIQALFLEGWALDGDGIETRALFSCSEPSGDLVLQALPSGPRYPTESVRDVVVSALHQARLRILLTTPYFVPDQATLIALRVAAQSGVRVEVVVPQRSNFAIADAAGRAYLRELVGQGVHAYLHNDGLMHTKSLTIDDTFAVFGSSNFDIRSFRLNFEANLLVYSKPLNAALRGLQERYLAQSQPYAAVRTRLRRIGDDCAKLLSPLF